MAQSLGSGKHQGVACPDAISADGTLVEQILDAFMNAHRPDWAKHTVECYRSALQAFYQEFPRTPGRPSGVIRWLRQLKPLRQADPLKPGTRQDYYERIRYLYRWARDNVAGAQDRPSCPTRVFPLGVGWGGRSLKHW